MKYSDDNHVERNPAIIIYCKEWCTYLQNMVNFLRERQWSFTFVNLEFDSKKAQTLISSLGNPLILPVLEVEGFLYEKPNYKELKRILYNPKTLEC